MTLDGAFFGTNLRRLQVALLPVTGYGPAPQCTPHSVRPERLQCALSVPAGTGGVWNLTLAVLHPAGPSYMTAPLYLEVAPLPPPQLHAAGCDTGTWCAGGALVTVQGAHFEAYAAGNNVVALAEPGAVPGPGPAPSGVPTCAVVAAAPDRVVCRLAVPGNTTGQFTVRVLVAGQASAAILPLFVHAAVPHVRGVACAAAGAALQTLPCAGGRILTIDADAIGAAATDWVHVKFANGTGTAPACESLQLLPGAVECYLGPAGDSSGVWNLELAVGALVAHYPVPFLPLPPPTLWNVTGCPQTGCRAGDTLTIEGRDFGAQPQVLVEASAGPAPTCDVALVTRDAVWCVLDASIMAAGLHAVTVVAEHGASSAGSILVSPPPAVVDVVQGCPNRVCAAGAVVTLVGSGFGTNRSWVSFALVATWPVANDTDAPVPQDVPCHVLRAANDTLEVWLHSADPELVHWWWAMRLTVLGQSIPIGPDVRASPAPAAEVHDVTGCSPAGCQSGDVLNITGSGFQPLDPELNAVVFEPTNDDASAVPACETTAVTAHSLGCVLRVPADAHGPWRVAVAVAGRAAAAWANGTLSPPPRVPVVSSVLCPVPRDARALRCSGAHVVTLLGQQFTDPDAPAGGAAVVFRGGAGPAPECAPLVTTHDKILCLLSVPPAAGGRWDLRVSTAAPAVHSAPVSVEVQPLPAVTLEGLSGCSPGGCRDGDLLQVSGSWLQPSRPNAYAVTFRHRDGGSGALPRCRPQATSCRTLDCVLEVPANASAGAWELGLTTGGVPSGNRLPLAGPPAAPVLTGHSCVGGVWAAGGCGGGANASAAEYGCLAGDRLVLRGAHLGAAAVVRLDPVAGGATGAECPVLSRRADALECVLSVAGASGPWSVAVEAAAGVSAPRTIPVLAPPLVVHGVGGCAEAPRGCLSGDVLTIAAQGLEVLTPGRNTLTFTGTPTAWGVPPTCGVLSATRDALTCALDAPLLGAAEGYWAVTLAVGDRSAALPEPVRVARPAPALAGVACEGAGPGGAPVCVGRRRVTLSGDFAGLLPTDVAVEFPSVEQGSAACPVLSLARDRLECALRVVGLPPTGTVGASVRVAAPGLATAALPVALQAPPPPTVGAVTGCGPACGPGATLSIAGADLGLDPADVEVRLVPGPGGPAGGALPDCPVLSVAPARVTCRLGDGVFAGPVSVEVRVDGAAATAATAVVLAAAPTVGDVRCVGHAGPAPAPPGVGCAGGHSVTLHGAHFGYNLSALALHFSDGPTAGPAPTAEPTAVFGTWLSFVAEVPASAAGDWDVQVAVGDVVGAPYRLAVRPMPAPRVSEVSGCTPEGCVGGARLTIAGAHFAAAPTANTVQFTAGPGASGPPPECLPLAVAIANSETPLADPASDCGGTQRAYAAQLECRYTAAPPTAGLWFVGVTALGVESATSAAIRAFTATPTPTLTPTASPSRTGTNYDRELWLLPQWAPPGALFNGVDHALRVALADTRWTRLELALTGAATLRNATAETAALCEPTGTGLVCDIGARAEATVDVVLRPEPLWWQLVPDPLSASAVLTAELYSAPAPAAPYALYRTATLPLVLAAPDLAVRWVDGLQGLSITPGMALPVAAVVTNAGLGWAEGVSVAINFHPSVNATDGARLEVAFAPAFASPAACALGAASAACELGAIPPATQVTLTFTQLRAGPVVPDSLPFYAHLTSVTPDPDAANNAAELLLSPYGAAFRMAPDAGAVDVVFSNALDLRDFPAHTFAVDCARVLSAAALALAGASPACTLVNARLLRVTFRARPTLLPGMTLALSTELRPAVCAVEPCAGFMRFAGVVTVEPMPAPAVTLQAPAFVGPCQALHLDASHGLVTTRFFELFWNATRTPGPADPDPALIGTLQAAAGADAVTLPAAALSDGAYVFQVEVVDYFGRARAAARPVTRGGQTPPSLTLTQAAALTIYTREPLVLGATARATTYCEGPVPPVWYRWESPSHPGLLAEVPTDAAVLQLAPYALPPGNSYIIIVRAIDGTHGLSTTESVTVTVRRSPLHVHLAGGLTEDLLAGAELLLDTSGSYDPDAAQSGSGALGFGWAVCGAGDAADAPALAACDPMPLQLPDGTPQEVPAYAGLEGAGTAMLTASGAATAGWPGGWTNFVVQVTSEGRAAEAQKWVRLGAAPSPLLTVVIAGATGATKTPILHNAFEPLVLRALVATARAAVQYAWRVWDAGGTAVALDDAAVAPFGAAGKTLVINTTRLLLPQYVVRVQAATEDGTAEAWMQVGLNFPPVEGWLTATLDAGTGNVTLQAKGWRDPDPALLRYRFRVTLTSPAYNVTHILNPVPQYSPTLTAPAPLAPEAATAVFAVEVLDARNATSVAQATLPLPPAPAATPPEVITATVESLLSSAIGLGTVLDPGNISLAGQPLDAQLVSAFSVAVQSDAGTQNWLEALRLAAEQGAACTAKGEELLRLAADAVRGLSPAFPGDGVSQVVASGLQTVGRMMAACTAPDVPLDMRFVKPGLAVADAALRAAGIAVLDELAARLLGLTPGLHGHRACLAAQLLTLCAVSGVAKTATTVPGPGFNVTLPAAWPSHARRLDGRPLPYHEDVGMGLVAVATSALNTSSFIATLYAADGQPVALALPQDSPLALDLGVPFTPNPEREVQCMYFDPVHGIESNAGLSYAGAAPLPAPGNGTAANRTAVHCNSTHLTEFFVGYRLVPGTPPTPPGANPECAWYLWVALGWWVLYAAGCLSVTLRAAAARPGAGRGAPPAVACGCLLRSGVRSLWEHFLLFHDWLAVPFSTLHCRRHLTQVHVTVLGAMLGNLVLLDAPHALPLRALWALLAVLPVRGAAAALFRFAAAGPPAPHRPVKRARKYNPLQPPRAPEADAGNPLQPAASDKYTVPLPHLPSLTATYFAAAQQQPPPQPVPMGEYNILGLRDAAKLVDHNPLKPPPPPSAAAHKPLRPVRDEPAKPEFWPTLPPAPGPQVALSITAPSPRADRKSSATSFASQWQQYLSVGLGSRNSVASDFTLGPDPRSRSPRSRSRLSSERAALEPDKIEADLLTGVSEEEPDPVTGTPFQILPPSGTQTSLRLGSYHFGGRRDSTSDASSDSSDASAFSIAFSVASDAQSAIARPRGKSPRPQSAPLSGRGGASPPPLAALSAAAVKGWGQGSASRSVSARSGTAPEGAIER